VSIEDKMSIRRMRKKDIPFFNCLRNECSSFLHDQSKYSLDESLKWFEEERPKFFILEFAGDKIGYFRTSIEDVNFFIGLDIHKNWRGKGLATTAYKIFLDKIKKNLNIKEVYLKVLTKNQVALNLYRKLGFVETRREMIDNKESIEMRIEL
tara:strand:- start:4160 stop:4615 length:456 start_codon:yes stop_codon:yes gene_type:complete